MRVEGFVRTVSEAKGGPSFSAFELETEEAQPSWYWLYMEAVDVQQLRAVIIPPCTVSIAVTPFLPCIDGNVDRLDIAFRSPPELVRNVQRIGSAVRYLTRR